MIAPMLRVINQISETLTGRFLRSLWLAVAITHR